MVDYNMMSDTQLISIMINEREDEDVSVRLIEVFSNLPELFLNAARHELTDVKGIGEKRVLQLQAFQEISKRICRKPTQQRMKVTSPEDISNLLMGEMRYLKHEEFRVILLNSKSCVIEVRAVSVGSLNEAIIHPREVFIWPVKHAAASIILIHNHPSGDPQPSAEDIKTTKRLVDAGNILGIRVVDHVIFGDGQYVSFKQSGLI